jgi:hypothetical protein
MLERLDDDLFDICNRIKDIDCAYTIYRNHCLDRFEVFHEDKFSFVVPFDSLDERTLVYTKKTRRENADEIERDIDEGNKKNEEQIMQKLKHAEIKLADFLQFENGRL